MKQQDWTEQLRHRLSEYEEPVPEGLWDGIERRMQHRARMVALRRWVIGVAACGLLLIGGWQLFKKGQELPSPAGQLVAANTEEEQEQVVADGTPNEAEVWDGAGSEGSNMLPAYHREHIEVRQATPQEETQMASQESSEEASQATSQEETQAPPAVPPHQERETMMPPASRDRPLNMQRKLRRISMQLHATNLLAQNGVTQIRPALLTRSFMETLSQDLSDRGPFYLANYEKRTEHNMPLTVGLSVSLPLTDRWWVASGVDFSRVTSTLAVHQLQPEVNTQVCVNVVLISSKLAT